MPHPTINIKVTLPHHTDTNTLFNPINCVTNTPSITFFGIDCTIDYTTDSNSYNYRDKEGVL